jgi:hypothetical protein
MRAGTRLTCAAVAACAAALVVGPVSANAAQSVYHPKQASRDFANSDGHWKGSKAYSGVCGQGVTCPEVTNSFEATGGASGANDGHLRTSIDSIAGVLATSDGVYTSPGFKYRGVNGSKAKRVSFSLSMASNLTPFLDVAGNSASYSIDLLDKTNGSTRKIVDAEAITASSEWGTVRNRIKGLKIGHRYKVRVTSEFKTGVLVSPGGHIDYDNVKLLARGIKGGSQASGPDSGDIGHGIKPVKIKGNHLKVPFKCPKSIKPGACDARIVASLTRKGKQATNSTTIRVRPGAKRTAKLHVRRGFRNKIQNRKAVYVHVRVRAKHHVYRVTRKVSVR